MGGGKDALHLVVVVERGILVEVGGGAVDVVEREDVGLVEETAVVGVGGIHVLDARADVGRERELSEILVDIEDGVAVDLAGIVVGAVVGTVLAGEEGVGGSRKFLLVQTGGLVDLGTSGEGDALGDVEGESAGEHVAVLVVDGVVAVDLPVGVHHGESLVAEGPVHGLEVALLVVLLIGHVLADVVACGEEVDRHDGVEVQTL